jgi:hypothetical protein
MLCLNLYLMNICITKSRPNFEQTKLNKSYIHIHLKARPLHRGQPISKRLVIASRIITIYTNHVDKTQCIYLIFKLMNNMYFLCIIISITIVINMYIRFI